MHVGMLPLYVFSLLMYTHQHIFGVDSVFLNVLCVRKHWEYLET